MNYEFDKDRISQQVVKYGLDVQPAFSAKADRTKLQDYCNRLIERYPEVFETLLAGPNQLQLQKSFLLADNKRVQMPTFLLTPRGPLFTFPQRIYIDQPQDIAIPERGRIFRQALEHLRESFSGKTIPRIGVIHEIVFDTGEVDSVEILAGSLKSDLWRQSLSNLRLHLELNAEDKNIVIDLRPTRLAQFRQGPVPGADAPTGFGIAVIVDINNRQAKPDLGSGEIRDIVTFADDFIADKLIGFLNSQGEYE